MKSLIIGLFVLTSTIGAAMGADKTIGSQERFQQQNFLESAKSAMDRCLAQYSLFLQVKAGLERHEAARKDLMGADAETRVAPPATPPHVSCVAREKTSIMYRSKDFVGSFKTDQRKGQANATVAQWLTAMDAIGTPVGLSEQAKFQTLFNSYLLDFQ